MNCEGWTGEQAFIAPKWKKKLTSKCYVLYNYRESDHLFHLKVSLRAIGAIMSYVTTERWR